MNKCLQCGKSEEDCKCEGGFKIIYFHGKPVSKKEADEIKELSDPERIKENINNIKRFFKELKL